MWTVSNLYVAMFFLSSVAWSWPKRDCCDSTKKNTKSLLQRLFCFTQTAIAAKHCTILYNRHRLARRNYAAGHQKLLSLAGGSAVDVQLILQWKTARERQFQSDLGFKVLLLFRRELSLSKKQSEYSWNVSSSSENKSQKPKTAQKPRLRSDAECFTAFVCVAIDARRPFPIPVT